MVTEKSSTITRRYLRDHLAKGKNILVNILIQMAAIIKECLKTEFRTELATSIGPMA